MTNKRESDGMFVFIIGLIVFSLLTIQLFFFSQAHNLYLAYISNYTISVLNIVYYGGGDNYDLIKMTLVFVMFFYFFLFIATFFLVYLLFAQKIILKRYLLLYTVFLSIIILCFIILIYAFDISIWMIRAPYEIVISAIIILPFPLFYVPYLYYSKHYLSFFNKSRKTSLLFGCIYIFVVILYLYRILLYPLFSNVLYEILSAFFILYLLSYIFVKSNGESFGKKVNSVFDLLWISLSIITLSLAVVELKYKEHMEPLNTYLKRVSDNNYNFIINKEEVELIRTTPVSAYKFLYSSYLEVGCENSFRFSCRVADNILNEINTFDTTEFLNNYLISGAISPRFYYYIKNENGQSLYDLKDDESFTVPDYTKNYFHDMDADKINKEIKKLKILNLSKPEKKEVEYLFRFISNYYNNLNSLVIKLKETDFSILIFMYYTKELGLFYILSFIAVFFRLAKSFDDLLYSN